MGTAQVGKRALVEAQIGPGGKETEPGENGGDVGAKEWAGEGVGQKEQGGEVLDTDLDEALEQSYGVFWDQLLEGDEEAGLQRDAATDGGEAVFGVRKAGAEEGGRAYDLTTLPVAANQAM